MEPHGEPASPGQRLLWMLDHHRGSPGSLNCPLLCRLTGVLDQAALDVAVQRLTARHESLRTTFRGRGRGLTQVVHAPRAIPVGRVDLSSAADPRAALRDAMAEELQTPIDVARWPVRVTLWSLAGDEAALCVNVHHMVTDAWSCGVMFHELVSLYGCALGPADDPQPPGWSYRRWARWQERADPGRRTADREFWRQRLSGAEPLRLGLHRTPEDRVRTTARLSEDIDARTWATLGRLAKAGGVTIFSLALAAYYAVLRGETGQRDLAVASLFANRAQPEVRNSVGFFASLVVLRMAVDPGQSYMELARAVQLTVVDAMIHEALPYHLLPAGALVSGDARVDDVVFQMLPAFGEAREVGGVRAEVLVPESAVSRFDLELTLVTHPTGVTTLLQYVESRVPAPLARRLLERYRGAIRTGAAHPETSVAALAA